MPETYSPNSNGTYEFSEVQKKALLGSLKSEHEELRKFQAEPRRRWTKLELYLAGRQVKDGKNGNYVGHEIASAASETGDVDDEYFIINDTRRIHLQNMQRLTSYTMQASVIPNSLDPDDKEAARLGRMVLSTIFDELGEKKFKRRIARILGLYGVVFFKTYFDPSAGRIIAPLKLNPFGKPYYDQSDLRPEGRVIIAAVSPRNILMPAACTDIKKADEVEEVSIESLQYIWRRFKMNVRAENITFDQWDNPAGASSVGDRTEMERLAPKNSVLLRTRYILPCPRFQRGAIITYCDNHILEAATYMDHYNGDEQMWSVAECQYDDRTPIGESLLWDEIPIQDGLNQVATAMVNHIKMFGDGQMTIPSSAGLDADKITNKSGRHLSYNGKEKPEPIEWPELSDTHFRFFEGMRTVGQSLTASHDIARVNKAQSGNAISNLQEIDDTVIRPTLDSIEGGLSEQCKIALGLVEDHYTSNRLVKMTNMKGWQIENAFRGDMLKGNWHAKISLMTGMPTNPAYKRETINAEFKLGLLDRDEARVHLEVGNTDDLMEEIQKENEIADSILKGICDYPGNYVDTTVQGSAGPMPGKVCKTVYHTFDNHDLLVKKLLTYMRENYDHEPQTVKQTLDEHLKYHQDFLAASMIPAPPGAGPHPLTMMPPAGGKPPIQPPQGAPGSQVPRGTPGKDSVHSAEEQPPREMIPTPGNTGLQATPGRQQ